MSWFTRRRGPGAGERWLVVDVESSGLDPRHDRLLAIAAVALHTAGPRPRLRAGDSFEALLRQPQPAAAPDRANILVHGIGVGAQQQGLDPAAALAAFEAFAAGAPLVGFHSSFDRVLIERAARAAHGRAFSARWADLADVAPALHPGVKAQALDDWLAHFGIRCLERHRAAADAWATAELLQCLWPRLAAEGATSFDALRRLGAQRRWLGGG